MVPSSSMSTLAPVSATIFWMTLPPLPMTSRMRSGSMCMVIILGAYSLTSARGSAMQGSMQLESGGRDITITRTTKTASAPMREFYAVYTGTSVSVEGLNGNNAGEMLTGVSRDVFRRSAFVEQGSIAFTGSPELEKRINAIVSTGDEGCSFSEADTQLRVWLRSRRYNTRGKLPELEKRMTETKNRLAELDTAAAESERLTEQLEQGRETCKKLEEAVTEKRKTIRREALLKLHDIHSEITAASDAHEAAAQKRDGCRAALSGSLLGNRAPQEAESEVKADIAKSLELKAASEIKSNPTLPVVLIVLALALIAAAAFALPASFRLYGFIASGVLLVLAGVLYAKLIRARSEAHDAGRQRKLLLSKYKVADELGVKACFDEYMRLYDEFTAADEDEKRTARALSRIRLSQEAAEARALQDLDFSAGDNEAAQLKRELSAVQRNCDLLSARISEIKGRIETLGDPLVLGSELKNMESLHETMQAEFDAIALAVETLREADADIQSRFSPELGRLAAQYMSVVTGGRYESILINRDFTAKTRLAGDVVPRETEYLSAGTLDLMYLAVRLAVCTLALPEDASCPLILDDTLVNLDAERTAQAMKLLSEIAKQRQVILFTCKEV